MSLNLFSEIKRLLETSGEYVPIINHSVYFDYFCSTEKEKQLLSRAFIFYSHIFPQLYFMHYDSGNGNLKTFMSPKQFAEHGQVQPTTQRYHCVARLMTIFIPIVSLLL